MGKVRFVLVTMAVILLVAPQIMSSGFAYDGLGVKARGMGGAFRAIADDWSAAFYNPAGYNKLQDNILALNVGTMHNRYWANPRIKWGGIFESGYLNNQRIANHHAVLNIPQGGFVTRMPMLGGETVLGLAIMQVFDQNQSWELFQTPAAHNDSGVFPEDQFGINLDAVAFQLTAARGFMEDKLSLGLGLSLMRGDLVFSDLVMRDNPMASPISDRPHDKIPQWYRTGGNGWGFGWRLGALYDATEKIRVGATITGPTSIDLEGEADMRFIMGESPYINQYITSQQLEAVLFLGGDIIEYTADFETTLDLPASIGGGVAWDIREDLTLALDAEMTFWSKFEGLQFKFSNYEGTNFANNQILVSPSYPNAQEMIEKDMGVPVVWKDAPRVAVGAEYRPRSFVSLRSGFGVDKSAVDWSNPVAVTQVPQFIDLGTKFSYSLGIGINLDGWTLEMSGTYTHHPDINVRTQNDQDGNGIVDNLPAYYEADNYQTVMGISYRF